MSIWRKFARYGRDERGVTILEYGLILAVASLIILALASIMGSKAIDNFEAINTGLTDSTSGG